MQVLGDFRVLAVQGGPMRAWTARPEGPGPFPGLVLLQEIFGVNVHIRDVAMRLAAEGFVVVAPELFHRTAPGLELGYDGPDLATGKAHKAAVTAEGFAADLDACLRWLDAEPRVAPGPRACVGFCFGGLLAFRAAADPRIGATASFYGSGLPTGGPGDAGPALDLAPRIRGRLACFFGGQDPSIPPEHVSAVRAALQAARVDHQLFVYKHAGHGFFCDRRAAYDPPAAADAWKKLLELITALR